MMPKKRADSANNATNLPPSPFVLTPTGEFGGDDGQWSTFYINIGDDDGSGKGQNFKVLVSTSSPLTIVPAKSEWCITDDCWSQRGVPIFNGAQPDGLVESNSWSKLGIYDLPFPKSWFNKTLGGTWGSDNVGLGQSSPNSQILKDQFVVEYIDDELYLGLFGLAAGDVSTGSGDARPPFLSNFYGNDQIPSRSYGYTAGASYKNTNKGVTGNLVLGGYDASRVNMNKGVNISMPNQQNNSLVVGVQSIIYEPNQNVEANEFSFTSKIGGFQATIDSTLPYLYLPDVVCDGFAERFQLTYDKRTNYYFLNSTAHANNIQQNATVTFKIGDGPRDSTSFANIVLPYAAFDLSISDPLVNGTRQYFPIRKSPDGTFMLGRSFLQEAYLVVDYDRHNFTVAPVVSSNPLPGQKLVSIYNTTYTLPGPTPVPKAGGGGISGGAIAGIVVGVIAVIAIVIGIFFWRRRQKQKAPPPYNVATAEIDTTNAANEIKPYQHASELDSGPTSPKSGADGFYGQHERKDNQPLSEMDSPPAELYSPPAVASTPGSEGHASDYFLAGGKMRRRGATRESSTNNTPGSEGFFTPVAELPGDEGIPRSSLNLVNPNPKGTPILRSSSTHSRGGGDMIDEVMQRPSPSPSPAPKDRESTVVEEAGDADTKAKEHETEESENLERRPSHTRGLSDVTVQSGVSDPTPEEREQWAAQPTTDKPGRPLSE